MCAGHGRGAHAPRPDVPREEPARAASAAGARRGPFRPHAFRSHSLRVSSRGSRASIKGGGAAAHVKPGAVGSRHLHQAAAPPAASDLPINYFSATSYLERATLAFRPRWLGSTCARRVRTLGRAGRRRSSRFRFRRGERAKGWRRRPAPLRDARSRAQVHQGRDNRWVRSLQRTGGMKTVIVGGVAAGASTGARLRRLDESAEIVVLERDRYVSFANCGLPYHIGGEIPDRESLLLQTPESLGKSLALDVRTEQDVIRIDRAAKLVEVRDLRQGRTYRGVLRQARAVPRGRTGTATDPGADDRASTCCATSPTWIASSPRSTRAPRAPSSSAAATSGWSSPRPSGHAI